MSRDVQDRRAGEPRTRDARSQETREKLLEGALRTLVEQGIAKSSARAIATTAGVNQALVFYHFGSVDELLAAACRHGAEQRVARHRERLRSVGSLSELLAFGRALHEEEREAGHVAFLGQLLAGAQAHPGSFRPPPPGSICGSPRSSRYSSGSSRGARSPSSPTPPGSPARSAPPSSVSSCTRASTPPARRRPSARSSSSEP